MKRFTPTHKILAVALLTLVGSCLLYWLVNRVIDHKMGEFIEVRDAQAKELSEKENMQRAQDVLDATFDTRVLLEEHLVSVDEPLEFLGLVDDTIPQIAGARAEVVSISKETGEKKGVGQQPPHVSVVLNAQGDWENLYHLLLLLEHMPYAVSFDRVVLTSSRTEDEYAWNLDLFLTGGVR